LRLCAQGLGLAHQRLTDAAAADFTVDDKRLHDGFAGLLQGGALEHVQDTHHLALDVGNDDPMVVGRQHTLEAGAEDRLVDRVGELADQAMNG